MKRLLLASAFPGVALLLGLPFMAAQEPARGKLAEEFQKYDRDKDGRVTAEELAQPRLFKVLDANGDGAILLEEAEKVIRERGAAAVQAIAAEAAPASEPPVRQGPKVLRGADRNVSRLIPDVGFTDLGGRTRKLSDLKSHKAVVIAVTSTSCPLSRKFLPTLAQLEKDWQDRGVAFVFVNPISTDKRTDMAEAIQANGISGSYVADETGALARAAGATSTTDVVVLDAARTVVYHGAVDDQYGFGYSLDAPRVTYLKDALKSVVDGSRLVVAATEAPGCALELDGAPAPAATEITWHSRVSRIVQQHCVECHRDGGVAPFELTAREDLIAHKAMIKQVLERGAMPPWFAAPIEDQPARWSNDRALPEQDKFDLLAWLSGGHPEGDPADAPLPSKWSNEWLIGTPDAVLQLSEPVAIKATGTMPYQNISVTTSFEEERWVRGFEIRPTDRAVVHHVLVFVDSPEDGEVDESDERRGFLAAYVPGNSYVVYPPGFAKRLRKGATLRFQMHYTPAGKATTDQTRLGLLFADEPPRHEVKVHGIADVRLNIPPGAASHEESTSLRLPADTQMIAFMPHMHVRGKAFKYEAELPDGTRQVLLDIPRYDFNWQFAYRLNEPQLLPAGTNLKVTAWYDNSSGNPANPDPTKTVRWGPQTFDEMMIGYVEYFVPAEEANSSTPQIGERGARLAGYIQELFNRMDANKDAKVSRDEWRQAAQQIQQLRGNVRVADLVFTRLDRNRSGFIEKEEIEKLPEMLQRGR